jgi:hypothetical protein
MYRCAGRLTGTCVHFVTIGGCYCAALERSALPACASMTDDAVSKQQGAAKQAEIKFNQKSYSCWSEARDAYRSVSRNVNITSVWSMVYAEADDVDDDNKPFQLKCKKCNCNCQLNNPSKWKREHNCKKTARRGIGSVSALPGAQIKFIARLHSTSVLVPAQATSE